MPAPPQLQAEAHSPASREGDEGRERRERSERRARPAILLGAVLCTAAVIALSLGRRGATASSGSCPSGMSLIRGATFRLGSLADADTPSDETSPSGQTNILSLPSFCIDTTEVTVDAYRRCKPCQPPAMTVEFEGLTPKGRAFESQFCNEGNARNHPMNCVDWFQAKAYCASEGKRLPTEAEWELAARGTSGRTYPWGEADPSAKHLNACGVECSRMLTKRLEPIAKGLWPTMYDEDDSAAATAPVGHYPEGATPEGVLDLAGNVWEWTESAYCPYPIDDGAACHDSRRVLRGGGWDTTERQNARAARRYPSAPNARGKSVGFRCAKTL